MGLLYTQILLQKQEEINCIPLEDNMLSAAVCNEECFYSSFSHFCLQHTVTPFRRSKQMRRHAFPRNIMLRYSLSHPKPDLTGQFKAEDQRRKCAASKRRLCC